MSDCIDYTKLIRVGFVYHDSDAFAPGIICARSENHYVWFGSTIEQLFNAAGVPTKLRNASWMQFSSDSPLKEITSNDRDEAIVREGSTIHFSPRVTE